MCLKFTKHTVMLTYKQIIWLVLMVHAFTLSTQEVEADRSLNLKPGSLQGNFQSELHCEVGSQNENRTKRTNKKIPISTHMFIQ